MANDELQSWWPDLDTLILALSRNDHTLVAESLTNALSGSTSSEILGDIGIVLRNHRHLRSQLPDSARLAWDAIMADVDRDYPLRRFVDCISRIINR